MAVAATRMTAAQYRSTPEGPPRTELIAGEVVVNAPKLPHVDAQTEILFALKTWVREAPGRGGAWLPADVPIDDANVFAPDVWWVSEANRPRPAQELLERAPDLIVEVRSRSTWARDRRYKLPRYARAGVLEAWYVDTATRSIEVFRRSSPDVAELDEIVELRPDDTLTSPLLPGFELTVAAAFPR